MSLAADRVNIVIRAVISAYQLLIRASEYRIISIYYSDITLYSLIRAGRWRVVKGEA